MVEQRFCKPLVGGSNPSTGTSTMRKHLALVRRAQFLRSGQELLIRNPLCLPRRFSNTSSHCAPFVGLTDGKVADYIPGSRTPTRTGSRSASPLATGSSTKSVTRASPLPSSRSPSRSRTGSCSRKTARTCAREDRRRALRRGVQRDQPAAPNWCAVKPLINAGAIAACGLIQGDTEEKTARVLGSFSRCGRPARHRRAGLQLRERHRAGIGRSAGCRGISPSSATSRRRRSRPTSGNARSA